MTTPLEPPAVIPGSAPNSTSVPNLPPSTQNPSAQYFTVEQLEAARRQERDRLYERLNKQQSQIDEFKGVVDALNADKVARDAEVERQRKAAEDAAKKEAEAKLSFDQLTQAKQQELEDMKAKFQSDMELQLALIQKERELDKLQAFIQRRVAEEILANTIIPDLVEYIGGDTEAEVEISITKAKEKTANIVKGATSLTTGIPGGVSPTGGPSGVLDQLSPPRELTPEEIRNMPMDKFREYRRQSGLDRAGNGQGLFG